MKLDEEERAMLAGEAGTVLRTAMKHELGDGRSFGATDFASV